MTIHDATATTEAGGPAARNPFDLTGRVVVVTGATRGLGRGFASELAKAGAAIVAVGRDEDRGHTAVAELAEDGADAVFVQADLTRRDEIERVHEQALESFGRVDILVNNAGACVHAPALEVTPADWRSVMAVNLDAVWDCSQVFGQSFVEQRSGVIVNVGSISAMIVNRPQWQPAYNASKAAVHQLTRSLAAEWAPWGVRVNAIAPGYVRTDMAPVDDPVFRRHWIEDTPLLRAASVEEIAPSVLFLASDASSFVTGSVLVADGGYTAF